MPRLLIAYGLSAFFLFAGSFPTVAQADSRPLELPVSTIREVAEAAYGGEEPGAAVLVMQGSEIVLAEGFGMADMEWSARNTANTSFRIGSITKPFTAVAILQLVESGRIDLDQPISAYLADLPEQMGRPTIGQLLSHTSGLPDHFALPVIPSIMRNPIAPQEIVALMAEAEPQFEPGTGWSYSNFNYILLGRLIEAMDAEGRDYGTYIEEEIFAPLGMEDSHYDRQSAVILHRARGYDHDGTAPVNTITSDTSLAYAAGALMSSAQDMARFTTALREGTLLGSEMQDIAWTAIVLPDGEDSEYGLGFNVSEFLGERVIWHNGSINGFQAAWIYMPESDRAVAILSNGYYRPNTTTIARRILATLANVPVPDFEPVDTDDAQWSAFEGRYRLSNGHLLQIHVQDGVRFNIDGGSWRELTWSGGDVFYRLDTLSHLRLHQTGDSETASVTYLSTTLARSEGRRIDGAIESAEISVPLDPDEAARIAGNWMIASGDIFTLDHDGERLTLRLPGQPPQNLHRDAGGRYFVRGVPITLTVADDMQTAEINLYGNILALRRE